MKVPVPRSSTVFVTGTTYSLRTVPVPRNVYTLYRYILMFTFRYWYRFNFCSLTVISTGTYTSNIGSKSQYSRYGTGTIGIYIIPVPLNVYNLYRYRAMFTTGTGTVQHTHFFTDTVPLFSLFSIIEILVPGSSNIPVTGTVQFLHPVTGTVFFLFWFSTWKFRYQKVLSFSLPVPSTLCLPYRYHEIYTLYRYRSMFTTGAGTVQCLQLMPVQLMLITGTGTVQYVRPRTGTVQYAFSFTDTRYRLIFTTQY